MNARISLLPDPTTYVCPEECHHQAGRCGEWIEALTAIGCSCCGRAILPGQPYESNPGLAHYDCIVEARRAA